MIKFLPLEFLSVSHRIPWKKENAVYRLQISALVPEIFNFEKWVKYANEMTDVVNSTKYYIEYINRAILANLQYRTQPRRQGKPWGQGSPSVFHHSLKHGLDFFIC